MRVFTIALLLASTAIPSFCQKLGAMENLAPYIPTPQAIVERMLTAGHVTSEDVVYDLGGGDGRVVITAVQLFGARGRWESRFFPTSAARPTKGSRRSACRIAPAWWRTASFAWT